MHRCWQENRIWICRLTVLIVRLFIDFFSFRTTWWPYCPSYKHPVSCAVVCKSKCLANIPILQFGIYLVLVFEVMAVLEMVKIITKRYTPLKFARKARQATLQSRTVSFSLRRRDHRGDLRDLELSSKRQGRQMLEARWELYTRVQSVSELILYIQPALSDSPTVSRLPFGQAYLEKYMECLGECNL